VRTLPTFTSVDVAWAATLNEVVSESDGRVHHLVIAVDRPGAARQDLVQLNNTLLSRHGHHDVDRVASTIFPSSSYAAPSLWYSPDLSAEDVGALDRAAEDLYERYEQMLPLLRSFSGNSRGTYFGRLVSWPGKDAGGYNQLRVRIRQLRSQRNQRNSATNAADMTLEEPMPRQGWSAGLREYAVDDERTQGFPCLVHIDLSVVGNRLSILAVYRHWHVVRKAYGNLVGLTRLHNFLAQQAGYEMGELMIHATVATAEYGTFSHASVRSLLTGVEQVLASNHLGATVDGQAPPHQVAGAAGEVVANKSGPQ
jgi:hypothetical protein